MNEARPEFGERLKRHVQDLTPEHEAPFEGVLARLDRRHRRRRAFAASGTAMVVVAAIAVGSQLLESGGSKSSGEPATSSPSPSSSEIHRAEPSYEWSKEPSPVVLRLADRDIELKPWSYCWNGPPNNKGVASSICADGFMPTSDLKAVGAPESVEFWFGVEDWRFDATFTELGDDCPRQHTVQVARTGSQTFRVDPAGVAGRYRIDLFGRGPHGSTSASFLWTTTTDGPTDVPTADIALISGNRDEPFWGYQLEVGVQDLAFQPDTADVEVIATAANGRSITLDAELETRGECYAEGSLFFRGDVDPAQEAARLGPAPFTYEVLLTLDGKRYTGTAVWPRDEKKDEAPNTVLTFDPPLPAYTGD